MNETQTWIFSRLLPRLCLVAALVSNLSTASAGQVLEADGDSPEGKVTAANLDSYLQAAKDGDPAAQFELGYAYAYSDAIETDEHQAKYWFRKCAEQGYAGAQVYLAALYLHGKDPDPAEAVKWYRKAAEQRDADALYGLGWAYANGEGVVKDSAEAVKWFLRDMCVVQYLYGVIKT
jgi:TPR repeat protein